MDSRILLAPSYHHVKIKECDLRALRFAHCPGSRQAPDRLEKGRIQLLISLAFRSIATERQELPR